MGRMGKMMGKPKQQMAGKPQMGKIRRMGKMGKRGSPLTSV